MQIALLTTFRKKEKQLPIIEDRGLEAYMDTYAEKIDAIVNSLSIDSLHFTPTGFEYGRGAYGN